MPKPIRIGVTDETKLLKVTIHLRRRPGHDPIPNFDSYIGCPKRERLSNDEFAKRWGASQDDIQAVSAFCQQRGLTVLSDHAARRHVRVEGTVGQFNAAFGVAIHDHEKQGFRYHAPLHDARPPEHLKDVIIHVGLGHEPPDRADTINGLTNQPPNAPQGGTSSFVPPLTYMTAAGWPTGGAAGENIAVIVYGGPDNAGNNIISYSMNDVQLTCNNWGISSPTPINISVDGTPINTTDPTGEWIMDIAMAWGFGHGAQIVVYFSNNDINDTYGRIIFPEPGDPVCSVTTLSGAFHDEITDYVNIPSIGAAYHLAFADAAMQGVTICLPTGDFGSGGDVGDGKDHACGNVDPYALIVGGTQFGINPFVEWLANYGVPDNVLYNVGGGGGVSIYVPLPPYQASSNVPPSTNSGTIGRGIPDVSTVFGGQFTVFVNGVAGPGGGTSQSCPMTAGLIASINKAIGRPVGFLNPTLYAHPTTLCRDLNPSNTVGGPQSNSDGFWIDANNNEQNTPVPGYALTNGWDPCVGLGVINGNALISFLQSNAEVPSLVGITLSGTGDVVQNSPIGTVVGTLSVQTSAGTPFTGTLSVETAQQPFLTINASKQLVWLFSFPIIGPYEIVITATQAGASGSPLTQNVLMTVTPMTITAVTLSNSTVGINSTGTPVGTVTVASTEPFTGTFGLTGTSASLFSLIATSDPSQATLVTNAPLAAGSYAISIVATQAGATGSPFSSPFSIQAISGTRFTRTFTLVASMTTFTDLNVPTGDQTISVSPVTNPQTTLSSLSVLGSTVSGPTREFLVNLGLTSNLGSATEGQSPQNDKVCLFAGVNAAPGTSDVWALYTGVGMEAGSGNYSATGYELDFNNFNVDRGANGNLNLDLAAPIASGFAITGAGTKTNTTAVLIASEAPGGSNNQWARGLTTAGKMTICPYQDLTSAPVCFQMDGTYSIAAINLTSIYSNPGATTETALFMKNNQYIGWQNALATGSVADIVDTGNNRIVGVGSAGVFTGASCSPIAAGLNLGSSTNYWGQIFSPNGVVSPSDVALKTEVQPLPPVTKMIKAIEPIAFRWADPEAYDENLHYGFDASQVKAQFPTNFGGHKEYDGVQHLCKDELISVLWQSNREMLERIEKLELRLNSR